MKAIWSLWTKPLKHHCGWTWLSPKHHLLAWVLSVQTARQHYPETALFTDDDGAEMLVDGLGLKFDTVSTELNAIAACNPEWFALGKVYSYALQTEPFLHIDADVFLWNKLPARLEAADVLAQNPEYFERRSIHYPLEQIDAAIRSVDGWMPEELSHSLAAGEVRQAANCGVLGGNRVDFIRYYAELAGKMMREPRNQPAWPKLEHQWAMSCVFEQYLLTACVAYYQNRDETRYGHIDVQYLFASDGSANSEAAQMGYTHLLGGAKQNRTLLEHLERRVCRDYPEYYRRCLDYAGKMPGDWYG
jgi:hypothetical protein